MIIKTVPLTLLGITKKEGVGKKSHEPYKFYQANIVDTDGNVFSMSVDRSIEESADFAEYLKVRNIDVVADIKITPKGFGVSLSLLDFKQQ